MRISELTRYFEDEDENDCDRATTQRPGSWILAPSSYVLINRLSRTLTPQPILHRDGYIPSPKASLL